MIKQLISRSTFSRAHLWRGFGVVATLSVALLFGRSSTAEFEVPTIDTTNALTNVEFRNVWATLRSTEYVPSALYEAYAVGVDNSVTTCTSGPAAKENCNGIFYFYDGISWTRITNIFNSNYNNGTPFSLNAMVGQQDIGEGNPNPMWVVGPDGKIGQMLYYSTPGGPTSSGGFVPRFSADIVNGLNSPETRDFLAIDAVQNYNGRILAGGQDGLVAWAGAKGLNPNSPWTVVTPTITNRAGVPTLPSSEDITSIHYMPGKYAYVLTYEGSTDPTTPAYRALPCHGVTHLYRTTSETNWKYLGKLDFFFSGSWGWGPCSYGLDAVTTTGAAGGSALDVVFMATNNGIYKFDDRINAPDTQNKFSGTLNGTSNKLVTGVVALPDRGGSNINLLTNGDFGNTTGGTADGWSYTAEHVGTPAAGCSARSDFSIVSDMTSHDLRVWQQPDTCGLPTGRQDKDTSAVYQYIDLTTFEGQKYHITGRVKTEFPAIPVGYPNAPAPQGGVAIGCSGSVNDDSTNPISINCSLNNRSYIATNPSLTANGTMTGTTVDRTIDLTISREDGQFQTIDNGSRSTGPLNMFLQISCEATYGAKVTCSDLKVEEVNDPPVTGRNNALVLAAGEDGGNPAMFMNDSALDDPALPNYAFTAETLPRTLAATPKLTAMFGINAQHVYAVGSSTSGPLIFSRTPSTLRGNIWVGAVSPIDAGTGTTPVGDISVSCADDRGLSGTLKTLCQRSPDSYGVSLEVSRTGSESTGYVTTGSVSGRAWFGRQWNTQVAADTEALNLGRCLNAPTVNPSQPYNLAGKCNTTTRRCADTGSSCITDFDCYGRCEKDQGFFCTTDNDCRQTGTVPSNISSVYSFNTALANRLKCNTTYASPLACTSLGWLSFNANEIGSPAPNGDTGNALKAQYNVLSITQNSGTSFAQKGAHELSGWARFLSQASPSLPMSPLTGWVHLRGVSQTPTASTFTYNAATIPNSLNACRNCAGTTSGSATMTCAFCQPPSGQSCVPPNGPSGGQPACYYICEGTGTTGSSGSNPLKKCNTSTDCSGFGTGFCKAPGTCSTNTSQLCTSNNDCPNAGRCQNYGAICEATGASCSVYGVNLDSESGQFYGRAWSEDYGWLDFSPVTYGGNRLIQTRLGDIYAGGNIGSAGTARPQSASSCNGTYLITASGDINNFCSVTAGTSSDNIFDFASTIPFASPLNGYSNILGRFDLKGIETAVPAGGTKNKFGSTIVTGSWNEIEAAIDGNEGSATDNQGVLGGKVYVINGDTTISSQLTLKNSPSLGTNGSGAGVIIFNGNVTISAPILYGGNTITDLRQLASLTMIVKGNLTIDKNLSVTNGPALVGAYYVTGTFSTAEAPTSETLPLQINGLVIAKSIHFYRQTAGTIESPRPSELIIYDGRLQSNPMPGMTDFAGTLPSTTLINP